MKLPPNYPRLIIAQEEIDDIRKRLRDFGALNELLEERRFSDDEIAQKIIDSISIYNIGIQPVDSQMMIYGAQYPNLPSNIKTGLNYLTMANLLRDLRSHMSLEEIQVQSGNVTDVLNTQWRNLGPIIDEYQQLGISVLGNYKEYLNTMAFIGGVITSASYPLIGRDGFHSYLCYY